MIANPATIQKAIEKGEPITEPPSLSAEDAITKLFDQRRQRAPDLSSDASRGGFGNAATKREEDLPPCFRGNGLNRRSLPAPLVASYKQSSNQGSHRIAQSDLQPHRDRFDRALSRDPFRGAFANVENVRVTPEPGEFKLDSLYSEPS